VKDKQITIGTAIQLVKGLAHVPSALGVANKADPEDCMSLLNYAMVAFACVLHRPSLKTDHKSLQQLLREN